MFKMRNKRNGILLVSSLLLISLFQNCTKLSFQPVPVSLDAAVMSSVDGSGSGSLFYTNNRIVKINISVNTDMLDQMRLSTTATMNDQNNPWQPIQNKVSFDLANMLLMALKMA